MKNKKGTDKILSIYWFAILFIVAAGIVYLVYIFYGAPYDIRGLEASFLTNKIADCISQGGLLREEVFKGGKFLLNENNFLEKCNLNFNVEDEYGWKEHEQYYVEISFYDFSNLDSPLFSFNVGERNLNDFCGEKGNSLPFCFEKSFYTLDKENNQYVIKILSIVRKTEKNVK